MRFLACLLSALPFTELSFAGQFTTVLGGVNTEVISAIATDASGNTYGMGNSSGSVFVTKLDPNGVVLFTNYYGGKGTQVGYGIAKGTCTARLGRGSHGRRSGVDHENRLQERVPRRRQCPITALYAGTSQVDVTATSRE